MTTVSSNQKVFITNKLFGYGTKSSHYGFTLIELVIVISIIALVAALPILRPGIFNHWENEGAVRKLSETIQFLHRQAVLDAAFYRLEFGLADNGRNYYVAGEIIPEEQSYENIEDVSSAEAGGGLLSTELAISLNPSSGKYQNMIRPRSFPSLGDPVFFPGEVYIEDIRTMRGDQEVTEDSKPYIMFSPRGFSEFSVIHLRLGEERPVTILINPFTGLTEIYRSYKEFSWTYGQKE